MVEALFVHLNAYAGFATAQEITRLRVSIARFEQFLNSASKLRMTRTLDHFKNFALEWLDWSASNEAFPLASTYAIDAIEFIVDALRGSHHRIVSGLVVRFEPLLGSDDACASMPFSNLLESFKKEITESLASVICIARVPAKYQVLDAAGSHVAGSECLIHFTPTRCHLSSNVHERHFQLSIAGFDGNTMPAAFTANVLRVIQDGDVQTFESPAIAKIPLCFIDQVVQIQPANRARSKEIPFNVPSWATIAPRRRGTKFYI